jgi:hypothetical protein
VVGPAFGGLALATMGTSANFAFNALSYLGVIFVIHRWPRKPARRQVPSEHLIGAMRAGVRYARHSPILKAILVRSGLFVFFASSLWALLPIVARDRLGLGAPGYGLLVGCLGTGSLIGAAVLPRLSRSISLDQRMFGAGVVYALATLALGLSHSVPFLCAMLVLAGLAWLTTLVGVNVATQSVAPDWVQARALALYVLVTQGGMALGSVAWGAIADHGGDTLALSLSGAGLLAGLAAVVRWPLSRIHEMDIAPAGDWREPMTSRPFDPEDGPVLITVEYHIDPLKIREFCEALDDLSSIRRRDGAIRWEIHHDVEIPGRLLESFVVDSWAEHLRQHARVTRGDLPVWRKVRSYHVAERPPAVSHLIYERG